MQGARQAEFPPILRQFQFDEHGHESPRRGSRVKPCSMLAFLTRGFHAWAGPKSGQRTNFGHWNRRSMMPPRQRRSRRMVSDSGSPLMTTEASAGSSSSMSNVGSGSERMRPLSIIARRGSSIGSNSLAGRESLEASPSCLPSGQTVSSAAQGEKARSRSSGEAAASALARGL